MRAGRENFAGQDLLIAAGLLVFAVIVHFGRIGASIGGVDLETDVAMYCSIAAAWGHPEIFAPDFSFGTAANFATHVTPLVRLTHWLAAHVTDGNYGLAWLQLTGPVLLLHYLGFYALGRVFFRLPWKALIFTVLMGMAYWTPWGTYWGAGIIDYTPRVVFNGVYALFLCWALHALDKPRQWPVLLFLLAATVWIHPISALPAAAGIWLSFAASRPDSRSWGRHLGWLVLCGLCFVAGIVPYALVYLRTSGVSLGPDEVAYMDHILRTRFDIEYAEYWQGMLRFYRQYTLLPVLPLSLAATWLVAKCGTARERLFCRHIWLWIAGIYAVIALFLADQSISHALGRVHLEFDLVRVHRFLPFTGMCLIFLGANTLWRLAAERGAQWGAKRAGAARFVCAGLCLGFFLGGLHPMAGEALAWYWNRLDQGRYERAYADRLARREMVEAVWTLTPAGASVFCDREEQALRYIAGRPLTWCWKDACYLYYAKNLDALHEWERLHEEVKKGPDGSLSAALSTGAEWIVSAHPERRELYERLAGPVVWGNSRYLLVRNGRTARPAGR